MSQVKGMEAQLLVFSEYKLGLRALELSNH